MGLGPMAVAPGRQNSGIGSLLVGAGLDRCRAMGAVAVVVLGHPDYYPRFGFVPASGFSIDSEYDVPDEVFMAQELVPGALRQVTGRIHYHPAFADL
jgi:putative acetyltransferase